MPISEDAGFMMAWGKEGHRRVLTCRILLRWVIATALYYSGFLSLYRFFGGQRKPIILNYHRVLQPSAYDEAVPAGMVVRPKTFEKHLRYLRRRYRVVSVEELIELREHNETTGRPLCAITFDDGWRDNYEQALPLLRQYGLPATLFISTGFMGTRKTPWFYRLGDVLHRLAEMSEEQCAMLLSDGPGKLPAGLTGWLTNSPSERRRDIERVVEGMKSLPGAQLEALIERLERCLGPASQPVNGNPAAMLDWEQLREMTHSSFEIGSHGVTHFILTQIPKSAMKAEVAHSKGCIEKQLGRSIGGFSYPNGDYSDEIEALVRATGYRYACTTKPGSVNRSDSLYQLKRIRVHDDVTFSTALFACHISRVFKLV
jgi:peptidoglycan/xylan/chitin deacetylase (PgdA/CDA1 family)